MWGGGGWRRANERSELGLTEWRRRVGGGGGGGGGGRGGGGGGELEAERRASFASEVKGRLGSVRPDGRSVVAPGRGGKRFGWRSREERGG